MKNLGTTRRAFFLGGQADGHRIATFTTDQRHLRRPCPRLIGRRLAGLFVLAAFAAMSGQARAHDVTPLSFTMLPGGAANLNVKDTGFPVTCSATITVTSTNPLVTVDGLASSTKTSDDANFTIATSLLVSTPQTVDLTVCWVGADFPNPPCDENNCSSPLVVPVNILFGPIALNNSAGALSSASVNDPIDTLTGELYEVVAADLSQGGPMPLFFQRYYASNLRKNNILGDLGSNWLHNFDARLLVTGNVAIHVSDTGRVTRFLSGGAPAVWTQITHLDTPYQLLTGAGQDAVLFDPVADRIHTFDFTSGGLLTGKLVKVEDGRGRAHTLSYDSPSGQLVSVSDGLGRTLTFTYNLDAVPKIETVSDGVRSVLLEYTDPIDGEYLTRFTDARGWLTTYAYGDTSGNADHALLLSKQRPELNTPFAQTWYDTTTPDSSGRVATQTDSNGNTTTLVYDPQGTRATTITDPLGNTRVHTHSASGELARMQDEQGLDVLIASNVSGQRSGVMDRLGDGTAYTYHAPSGKIASVTNAMGGVTSFSYTARVVGGVTIHDLTGITHADGTTESFSYDVLGRKTSHTDQLGGVASATYDPAGNPLTVTNRAGGTVTHVYDAMGRRTSTTSPAGETAGFAYDALGRLSTISHPDGSTSSFAYDPMDSPLSITDENGHAVTFTYDRNGNPDGIQNALLQTLSIGYDGNDRSSSISDPLGNTSTVTFDLLGRVATRTDANVNTTSYGYDTRGRLASITLPGGGVHALGHDNEGILSASTTPLGNTTSYTSDRMGRLTGFTTPSGNIHRVTYDVMGRLASLIDPLGNTVTFSRDARGLLTCASAPVGATTAYARDALGRITGLTDPLGSVWASTFDASGRKTSDVDPLGNTTAFAYDDRDRLSQVTYPGTLGTLTLGYDPGGNTTSATWSDGTAHGLTHDAADRLVAATGISLAYDAAGRMTASNGLTIGVDPGGRTTTLTLAPGKAVTYTYDANDRVIQVADWAAGTTLFTYDADGRLTGMTRPNGVNATFTYDADGRVLSITEGALSDITLVRDARGNVTSAIRIVPTAASAAALVDEAQTYDAASRLVGASYDELGRVTASGTDTYTWNLASRLTGYTRGGAAVTSTYDAAGLRLSRTEGGTTRSFVWNFGLPVPSVSVEREGGQDLFYYVYLPDGRLLYRLSASSNARGFYHFDEVGSTLFVTNDAGAVVGSYAYSPFGRLLDSAGALDNPFTWGGQHGVMSEGCDLYYMRARYYDGALGRFLSRDPVRSIGPLGANPYQYAFANPQRYIDRTGLAPETVDDRLTTEQELANGVRAFTLLLSGQRVLLSKEEKRENFERIFANLLIHGTRRDQRRRKVAEASRRCVAASAEAWVETSGRAAIVAKGRRFDLVGGDLVSPAGARETEDFFPCGILTGTETPDAVSQKLMRERLEEEYSLDGGVEEWFVRFPTKSFTVDSGADEFEEIVDAAFIEALARSRR